MISVGNRDGKKELGLGLGLGRRFGANKSEMKESELEEGEACSNEEEDASIDPDVAFSYIGEKLESVLGHLQKDFEGVVSAENLGSKYGIYGSFLPAYRRSPVGSHPRSPPKVQNHNIPQSPNIVQGEGGSQTSLARTSAPPLSLKHGSASTSSTSLHENKASSQSSLSRLKAKTQSMQSLGDCTPKSETRDQRTLKVRIKVGSDNLSVKKNDAIYSGLGLDDSPSSSFDKSPMEGEGLPHALQINSLESPTQILQIMTSFPLCRGYLLSPLPDDIIQLNERPKFSKDFLTHSSSENNHENYTIGHISYSVKENKTMYGENGVKLDLSWKEAEIDADSCEELVSKALRLPLLSETYSTMEETVKDTLKEKPNGLSKREPSESFSVPVGLTNRSNERISDSRKVRDGKGEATNSSSTTETVGLKLKKTSNGGLKDPKKQKADKRSSSGDKKQSKRSQVHCLASKNAGIESANDRTQVPKSKQSSDVDTNACKTELKSSPFQKESSKSGDKHRKVNDTYKDFFGDINEQEGDMLDSPDSPSGDRLKSSEVLEKDTLANENAFNEKTSASEHKGAISGINLRRFSHNAGLSAKGRPISDLAVAGGDTEDSWVECDKCQTWRLLPPGSKVDSLPDKWDCSMLTWLPGMNRCGISEEETTKAVTARYQLLAEHPNSLHVPPDRLSNGIITADKLDPGVLNDEKTADKLRKISKPSFQGPPHEPRSSSEKKEQSRRDRTSAEAKESPAMNIPDFTKSNNKQRKMNKNRTDSDEGHAKKSNRRDKDKEFPRDSKKSKIQTIQNGANGGLSAECQGNGMMIVSGLAANPALKNKMVNSEYSSPRKPKDDVDGDSLEPSDKLKVHVEGFPDVASLQVKKPGDGVLAPKKRKIDSFVDPASSTPSEGKLMPGHEEPSRKKHRISKSAGKESSTSKRSGKAEKRSRSVSQQSLNKTLPKDSSLAATSSSSKVSGSFKANSKFQELKGSPVESVCSSPFRISNLDKLMSGSKSMVEKDNVENIVKLEMGSPIKCSDDDYQAAGGQSVFIRKEDSSDPGEQISDRRVNESSKNTKSNSDKGKVKIPESYDNARDYGPVYEEKGRQGKIKVPEKSGSNVDKPSKNATYYSQEPSVPRSKAQQDYDRKRSSKKSDVEKSEQLGSMSVKEKSRHKLASDGEKYERSDCPRPKPGNSMDACSSDAHANADLPKESKSSVKVDAQNGTHHVSSKHPISNGHRVRDAPSPLPRDATAHAAGNAIKEAKNFKHLADRLKQGAGSAESTGYYFEAALKFLHGASLYESGKTENTKHGDMLQAIKIYSDTAKLCEYCAHEFEKSKDMATAALAYKCMEVAYLRVIYSSHHSASRDRHELQTVLQMVPPGESPSSSASDIDNLNNTAMDKNPQARNGGSPQLATNLVIAPKNRPNFKRLLSFAQDVNFAMEASRKSRMAFAAANVKMDSEDSKDAIASIKRALDFTFQDVQGLLRLVRLAKEATTR